MIRFAPLIALLAFASLFLFPWPVAAGLGAVAAIGAPLSPLALGLAADALYLTPGSWPFFTIVGGVVTILAFFVRSRLSPRIMSGNASVS